MSFLKSLWTFSYNRLLLTFKTFLVPDIDLQEEEEDEVDNDEEEELKEVDAAEVDGQIHVHQRQVPVNQRMIARYSDTTGTFGSSSWIIKISDILFLSCRNFHI